MVRTANDDGGDGSKQAAPQARVTAVNPSLSARSRSAWRMSSGC